MGHPGSGRRLEGSIFRFIGRCDTGTGIVLRLLRAILPRRTRLSGGLLRFLGRLADAWADEGRMREAAWLYDELYRLHPKKMEAYLNRYEALGNRLYHQGRFYEAVEYWSLKRGIQDRLAGEHGLAMDEVAYLRPEWSMAYGHIGLLHLYIQRNLLLPRPKKIILLGEPGRVANQALLDYYAPWIQYDDSPATAKSLPGILLGDGLNILRSATGDYEYFTDALLRAGVRWRELGKDPLLRLTDRDRERGKALLQELGADPGGWFVCLHVRAGTTVGDRYSRNAPLDSYAGAVEVIARAGGKVIRIGPKLDKPPAMPGLIDYASGPHRTDWGDVFLSAACRFFLGTNSGPCLVPEAFGVPCVLSNWFPFGEGPFGGIYTPKLLWHEKEERYLSFPEMLKPPFISTERTSIFKEHQVRLVNNTPEDISLLVEQMLREFEGKGRVTPGQEEKQAAFQRMMKRVQPGFSARIGTAFLEKHRELMG